jgi:hypothetical protein
MASSEQFLQRDKDFQATCAHEEASIAGHEAAPPAEVAEAGMNPDPGRLIEVNGVSLYVEEYGAGHPVLLMHGWPDSARLWRNQVPFLVSKGFRVITPDMRGFGRSGRPQEVAAYRHRSPCASTRWPGISCSGHP